MTPEEQRQIEQVWSLLGRLGQEPPAAPETDAAWRELRGRLQAAPAAGGPSPRHRRDRMPHRHTRHLRAGTLGITGLLALLVLGLWLWQRPVSVVAPPGDLVTVMLPDGSRAELNSGTRLRYARGFLRWPFVPAPQRTVALEGEAFFEVVRDERPFVVETFNARVEVLGTQFNVWARREPTARETRVVLASGRVRVSAQEYPQHDVLLSAPGQVAHVSEGSAVPPAPPEQTVPLDRALVWRTRGFVAHQPLASILNEVERRYALSLEIQEGIALTDSVSVFYMHGATAEEIIHDICLARGCRYRKTSRGYVLYPK